ncbi:hypothetical protein WDU94_000522 [Cyamophila willieti]
MILKLQCYDLDVVYIPGKDMFIADTLSHAKFKSQEKDEELDKTLNSLSEDLRVHCNFLVKSINVTDKQLEKIKIMSYVKNKWPHHKCQVDDVAKVYFNFQTDLHVIDNILFKNNSIVIPKSMQGEMLSKMHEGHCGISASKNLVRGIIFWPSMNADIENFIRDCQTCLKYSNNNSKQPLHPHNIPNLPWEKVGTDLFHFDSKTYLIVVDYFSQFVEIALLNNSSNSQSVIIHLKSIFARHGIAKQIFSDNGPPFNSAQFKSFCDDWGIEHKTSSPRYPQSNGLVERTIGTIKNMLKKSGSDIYLALLNFGNTPKSDGISSPAKLLMSRNLRGVLPMSKNNLNPKNVSIYKEREKMVVRQGKMKYFHDRNARPLSRIKTGDRVVFKHKPKSDLWVPATVVQELVPNRSYRIRTPEGVVYERNRVHLKKVEQGSGQQMVVPPSEPPEQQSVAQPLGMSTPVSSGRPRRQVIIPTKFKDYELYTP